MLLNGDMDSSVGQLRLLELHSLVVLAEELHFARAARRLLVSPGALSRRISHVERVVGRPLLHRTTRTVGLTAEGSRLMPSVRRLVAEVHALHGHLDAL